MGNKKGIFYGVSVGPGDPELITIKAVKLLKRVNIIAAPRTKSGEMLALDIAKQAVDMSDKIILPLYFTMLRDKQKQREAHCSSAETIAEYLDKGEDVAMLNIGDVSIYSTYSYLMEILKEKGYKSVMISGVPSFCAVAARLGTSLTQMNLPVYIVPAATDIQPVLEMDGTKILMKSGSQLEDVLNKLDKNNVREKGAMVCNCGLPNEQVFDDLSGNIDIKKAGYFSTIIVKE